MTESDHGQMLIRLWVTAGRSPNGELDVDGGERRCFHGWLELLRLLSDSLEGPHPDDSPRL